VESTPALNPEPPTDSLSKASNILALILTDYLPLNQRLPQPQLSIASRLWYLAGQPLSAISLSPSEAPCCPALGSSPVHQAELQSSLSKDFFFSRSSLTLFSSATFLCHFQFITSPLSD